MNITEPNDVCKEAAEDQVHDLDAGGLRLFCSLGDRDHPAVSGVDGHSFGTKCPKKALYLEAVDTFMGPASRRTCSIGDMDDQLFVQKLTSLRPGAALTSHPRA